MAEQEEHVVAPQLYLGVLLTLMLFLALTLVTAFIDLDKLLGSAYWNMAVAVAIAAIKAVLIVLFFMHVKYGTKLTWAFATAGFFWLGILLVLSLTDYTTRNNPPSSPRSPPMAPSVEIQRAKPLL